MTIMSQRECLRKIVIINFASRNLPQLAREPNAFWWFAPVRTCANNVIDGIRDAGSRFAETLYNQKAAARLPHSKSWSRSAALPEFAKRVPTWTTRAKVEGSRHATLRLS